MFFLKPAPDAEGDSIIEKQWRLPEKHCLGFKLYVGEKGSTTYLKCEKLDSTLTSLYLQYMHVFITIHDTSEASSLQGNGIKMCFLIF